jgi:hypothetical protein
MHPYKKNSLMFIHLKLEKEWLEIAITMGYIWPPKRNNTIFTPEGEIACAPQCNKKAATKAHYGGAPKHYIKGLLSQPHWLAT